VCEAAAPATTGLAAAARIQEKNPDTTPVSRTRKDTIIDYIVEHFAGQDH
jgi:hypothetical protein